MAAISLGRQPMTRGGINGNGYPKTSSKGAIRDRVSINVIVILLVAVSAASALVGLTFFMKVGMLRPVVTGLGTQINIIQSAAFLFSIYFALLAILVNNKWG